ncbi:MAG TPA: L-threonylcarbamoyladenylate synthase [Aeromicrobium sp.]|nr:L-threonylcarbamoyladenylate synthase [Aeromicrobium sp.]
MRFDCLDPQARPAGLDAATMAIASGELVVLPTDTVYGVGADAFSPTAVERLVQAKGRGRDMPPPVLIGAPETMAALVDEVPPWLQDVTAEFWPGPLTVVCREQPSLAWDLGDTHGTVAVRVPADDLAIDLLKATGPMAVTSANLTGQPAATTIEEAENMLGDAVAVYLDGGPSRGGQASTVLDVTAATPRLLREGPVTLEDLHRFNNTIMRSDAGA